MRKSSAAKSEASSPPVPARTSSTTLRASLGSLGTSAALELDLERGALRLELADLLLGERGELGVAVAGRAEQLARLGELAASTSRKRRKSATTASISASALRVSRTGRGSASTSGKASRAVSSACVASRRWS